ncbi:TadE/TadG family type IV pilus assembly protein [Rhizobium sp. BK176]|uniref:TadE/TadG family type IV pilus assembly protein n=1 Tax=Rhizobium sp. BK176 TaxID=2587071 RepID=UPI002168AE26|nr:TadE/TadG family type IV pilus assembly protein [Rhizobium sp. BK176]MCS4089672.1 Flp pilus assembly protein TadG [Rhizobium sp. BK176]
MKKMVDKFQAAKSRLRSLLRDKAGVAGIEMALVTPMLLVLLCGGGEMALLLRSHFQASQMASTVADAISRYETITAADISGIFSVSSEVMGSGDFAQKGYVILSSVSRTSGATPVVAWQCKGGAVATASRVGAVTKAATLPQNLVLDATDNVVIAEVFYQYTPMFSGIVPASMNQQLYKTAVFRPRLGSLTTSPGC